MPYLNWKDEAVLRQEIGPAAPGSAPGPDPLHMTLGLSADQLSVLLPLLDDVLGAAGGELRVDLPRGWIVFWKRREGESRLLIAHPQADEWVATAALTPEHGQLLLERLRALESGQRLDLGRLAATGSVSNLEITLARA